MPRQLSAHSSVCEAAEPIPEQWGRPVRFSNTQDIAGQEWRYFTLIPCGSTETVLCLVFSVDAVGHWAAGVDALDACGPVRLTQKKINPNHYHLFDIRKGLDVWIGMG